MEDFLKSVERRAFRMAQLATGNRDDALDILQDAMLGFVRTYAERPRNEWRPLFYRVVQNRIRDWHRRQRVRQIITLLSSFPAGEEGEPEGDPIQLLANPPGHTPCDALQTSQAMRQLEATLKRLPPRQRQVFLLRAWEGLSVEETAIAMKCTTGTVKTHYFRAVNALRDALGEVWP